MTKTKQQLKTARVAVNNETFGTEAWEKAMQSVRTLADTINLATKEEFCSVDSGVHRTRISNGRII
jgi:hypothetical protein